MKPFFDFSQVYTVIELLKTAHTVKIAQIFGFIRFEEFHILSHLE